MNSYTGSDLSGMDFSGVNLSDSSLICCNLQRVNFMSADLSGCDLRGSDLTDAILFDTKLHQTIGEGKRVKTIKLGGQLITWTKHQVFINFNTLPAYYVRLDTPIKYLALRTGLSHKWWSEQQGELVQCLTNR